MAGPSRKHHLGILMLGKTGSGKSATGNSLLGKCAFNAPSYHTSVTQEVCSKSTEHRDYLIKVVDTPGLANTELSNLQDKETSVKNMSELLQECDKGIHVFVLVVRLDTKMTQEEIEVYATLKRILGATYLKDHGIVVVTHGQVFRDKMADMKSNKKFEEWIKQPGTGPLGDLFRECGYRCVLFDNTVKDSKIKKQQFEKFLEFAEPLRQKGIYTNEKFQKFDLERKKMILDLKRPILTESIQKEIRLMRSGLDALTKKSTVEEVKRIEKIAERDRKTR